MQAIYASAATAGVMLGLLFAGILKLIRNRGEEIVVIFCQLFG
jgi:hypothetical protein